MQEVGNHAGTARQDYIKVGGVKLVNSDITIPGATT